MELHYINLFFTFTLGADVPDRHLFFSSRARFAAAFRQAISCHAGDCAGCAFAGDCAYPVNFEQKVSSDPEAVKRHQKPPLPFVFTFPVLPPLPNRGCRAECSLTLFGSAVQETEHFITAAGILLSGIGATISSIEAECPGGGRTPAAEGAALPLLTPLDLAISRPLAAGRVELTFITPLKLVHDGRLLKQIRFSHLARALMRRLSAIAHYYEGAAPELDYRWLSQESDQIITTSSEAGFVSWEGRPAGLMGRYTFEGNLEPFHLLLQSGLTTHLGKGASFGYGAYQVNG